MSVEIVFETHSLSEDNGLGIATGWLDGRLSELGRGFARELGARRRAERIDVVYTSDLGRAVETTEIAFAGADLPIVRDARLRECNYGELNGMPVERLHGDRAAHVDIPYPGGESYRQVVERVRDFLDDVKRDRDGARVLVIGHSATRWGLDCLLGGAVLEDVVVAPFDWREGWEYVLT